MMNMDFDSLEELYNRVKPALITKKRELIRLNVDYVKEEDIWNYLREKSWKNSQGLDIATMVSNILNVTREEIDSYLKSKMTDSERKRYFNSDEIL